jgi:hypothetical protein
VVRREWIELLVREGSADAHRRAELGRDGARLQRFARAGLERLPARDIRTRSAHRGRPATRPSSKRGSATRRVARRRACRTPSSSPTRPDASSRRANVRSKSQSDRSQYVSSFIACGASCIAAKAPAVLPTSQSSSIARLGLRVPSATLRAEGRPCGPLPAQ